jgi:hypothetical protein
LIPLSILIFYVLGRQDVRQFSFKGAYHAKA